MHSDLPRTGMTGPPATSGFRVAARQGPWLAQALDGPADTLVIAFASVGHDPSRPPSPEFVGAARAGGTRPALFVTDASRSWGHAPGLSGLLAQALADVSSRGRIARIVAVGHSMGACLALQAAAMIRVDAVLAIGPQSHLSDPRWQCWTAGLPPLPPPESLLSGGLARGARIALLHGLADDAAQAAGFAPAPGLDHILFPGLTHSGLAAHLKARGCLAGLLEALIAADRRRLLRIAASAGGRLRRGTPIAAHQP